MGVLHHQGADDTGEGAVDDAGGEDTEEQEDELGVEERELPERRTQGAAQGSQGPARPYKITKLQYTPLVYDGKRSR